MRRRFVLLGIAMCFAPGCRDAAERGAEAPRPPAASPDAGAPSAPTPPAVTPRYSRPDWAAIHRAEAACADCHPAEVDAWRASPMGRSLGPLTAAAGAKLGPGAARHALTDEQFVVEPTAAGLRFAEVGGHSAAATHVVGSGAHTRSFVQFTAPPGTEGAPAAGRVAALMPLTWYRATAGWGLSPGYAVGDHPGFTRLMNLECLTCHGMPAATAATDGSRFLEDLPGAIGCARCHGDGRAHVEARLAGRAAPMVRPEALPPSLGADVCGQCHLQGAVRILRAGRDWDHMLPGQWLGEVVAVFARETPGADIGIASHAERLRRSRCVTANPEAGRCTTCHAPHATGARADRSAGCRGCHTPEATDAGAGHGARCAGPGGDDCAGCHMARTATHDIPHVAMTDHFIRRAPEAAGLPARDGGPLRWINRPPGVSDDEAGLLLGRAWAESARGRVSGADRDRAIALLEAGLARRPTDGAAWADLGSMKQLAGDLLAARGAMEKAVALPGAQAAWWSALAHLRVQTGALAEAADALARARALRPGHPDDAVLAAQLAMGRGDPAAIEAALAVVERLMPGQPDGWQMRGALARASLDPEAAEAAFVEATRRAPGDPRGWLELCRIRADRHRWDEAARACTRAAEFARGATAVSRVAGARARVALGRGDARQAAELAAAAVAAAGADATYVLGKLALDAGRTDDAMHLLDRAVQLEPTMGDAWAALAIGLRRQGEGALADRAAAQARRLGAP